MSLLSNITINGSTIDAAIDTTTLVDLIAIQPYATFAPTMIATKYATNNSNIGGGTKKFDIIDIILDRRITAYKVQDPKSGELLLCKEANQPVIPIAIGICPGCWCQHHLVRFYLADEKEKDDYKDEQ